MKKTILLLLLNLPSVFLPAQTQFAVVKPDGTTHICPTLDSAYNKAENGDNLYLPGGAFSLSYDFNKAINLIGAGHYADSSAATTTTRITNGTFYILQGASGGSIQGIKFNGAITFGKTTQNDSVSNFQIFRCYVNNNLGFFSSRCNNVFVNESVLNSVLAINNTQNFVLKKSIVGGNLYSSSSFSIFENTLFLYGGGSAIFSIGFSNSTFKNNIFLYASPGSISNTSYCSFINNLFAYAPAFPSNSYNSYVGNIYGATTIFVNQTGYSYSEQHNYHLANTSPGISAGSDGTDVGIYGTSNPTAEGWVPTNPHIYYKQVATQTNASGQLPVNIKVRTNN